MLISHLKQFFFLASFLGIVIPCGAQGAASSIDPGKQLNQISFERTKRAGDGLIGGIINIEQTPDGFKWISTKDRGLYKYDGIGFRHYFSENTPAFTTDFVSSMCVLRNGNLLLGFGDGSIVQFDGKSFQSLMPPDSASNRVVVDLFEDRAGKIWIGYSEGKIKTFEFTREGLEEKLLYPALDTLSLPVYWVSTDFIHQDQNEHIWIGTSNKGVYRITETGIEHYTEDQGLNSNIVWSIHDGPDGELWICTRKGVSIFDDGTFRSAHDQLGMPPYPVMDLVFDRAGAVWMPGLYGVYRSYEGVAEYYEIEEGVFDGKIMEDDEQPLIWVTSAGSTFYQFAEKPVTTLSENQGLASNRVISLMEDQNQQLWLGLLRNGIDIVKDNSVIKHIDLDDGLNDNLIFSLFEHPDNPSEIWAGSRQGVSIIKDLQVTDHINKSNGLSDNNVRVIYRDPNQEGVVWLGTISGGVNKYENGQVMRSWTEANGLVDNNVRWLVKDPQDILWIGTQNGMHWLVNDSIQKVEIQEGLSGTISRCTYLDPSGNLWIGTLGNGLVRYKDGKFKTFKRSDGLNSNDIMWITEDDNGYFWLVNQGDIMTMIHASDFESYESGKIDQLAPIMLGPEDGVIDGPNTGGFPAGIKTTDDKVLFPTQSGILSLDLDRVERSIPNVPFVESIEFNDSTIYFPQGVSLTPNPKNIQIDFSSPDFRSPHQLTYAYQLSGYEDEWVDVGEVNNARYPKLPPGKYTFNVRSSYFNAPSTSEVSSVDFVVKAAWYQSKWFFAICGLILASLVYLVYRWRVKEIKARNDKLSQLVDDRTANLSKAIEELKSTQAELVNSEKMALLGRLMANIAHEINTPLGAVNASNRNVNESLNRLVGTLPSIVSSLSDRQKDLFYQLSNANFKPTHLPFEQRRKLIGDIAAELSEKGVNNTEVVAESLVDIGIREPGLDKYSDLFVHPEMASILTGLEDMVSIRYNYQNIETAVERSSSILQALKKYVRGTAKGSKEWINVQDSVQTVMTLYSNQLIEGVTLEQSFQPVSEIYGNNLELSQLWTNLLQNALQAMKYQGKLKISIEENDGWVEVKFHDTGVGIPENIKDRIFEPFFTTKPVGSGTGLGLDIANKIVKSHGGEISFESEPGNTVFTVKLPVGEQGPEDVMPSTPNP